MGQYWKVVNLDKHELIHPHALGCGLKLREMANTPYGVGSALIILCAAMPFPRGGGDFEKCPAVGRWAGDRIALVGDYTVDNDLPAEFKASTIYDDASWTDISEIVAAAVERECCVQFSGSGWRTARQRE